MKKENAQTTKETEAQAALLYFTEMDALIHSKVLLHSRRLCYLPSLERFYNLGEVFPRVLE